MQDKKLTLERENGKIKPINSNEKWYHCPYCNKALFPLQEDTRIEHMPFRCKACKHDIEVNAYPTKMNNQRAKSL